MSLKDKRSREIEPLREMEKQAFGPRHGKEDFYGYLEGVWKLYLRWKADKMKVARAKQLEEFYGIKLRKGTHPLRAIIDASSSQGFRIKSRWARALQYIEKNAAQVLKVGFRTFVQTNGGIIGCAQKRSRPKTAPVKAKTK